MKAIKAGIIILMCSITASDALAQRYVLNPMNTIYADFYLVTADQSYGGIALSYDRLFSPKKTFSIKLGILPEFSSSILLMPLTIQGFTAPGREHHVDLGAGIVPAIDYIEELKLGTIYPELIAGYHFSRGTGFQFRATAHIVLSPSFFLSPSVSVGYLF